MSTHRDGGDQLSGEPHRPEAAPHLDATPDRGAASGLDDIAERIGEALRRQPLDDRAEEAALAAFRSARAANNTALRTRRRDRWGPVTRGRRWARTGALTVAAGTLFGGIAVASIGVVDSTRHHASEVRTTSSPVRSEAPAHGGRPPVPAGPEASPSASPSPAHHGGAKGIEAHCHAFEKAFEKGEGRGHALKSTAWQRLVRAAGGEQQVAGYCARLTGSTDDADRGAEKVKGAKEAKKAKKSGKAKNAGERDGRSQGRSSARPEPSKGPADRS
ncbi:hypothetical protein [Streptomyces sp. NPDC050145]|uniref:hypothetical protein n=1 Tax=Streptomyces sp. NPDC050145 TaxID=3365602 RepID=UPI0037A46563